MTSSATPTAGPTQGPGTLQWTAPGPGTWSLLADHYPRPVTPAVESTMPIWSEVTTAFLADLGLPISQARMRAVNGMAYINFEFQGGPGAKEPPAWVMKIAMRLVPSLRRSEATASRMLRERPWNEGIRRWYEVDRPAAVERMTTLTRVKVAELEDAALANHIRECFAELKFSLRHHLSLHAHDSPAPALFAVRMVDWGFTAPESFEVLAGASPASTGASPELAALRAAVAGRTASSLEELRSLGTGVSDAIDSFLEFHGWRLMDGYDIDGKCIIEAPALVVALATAPPPPDRSAERQALVDHARSRVPEAERAAFDAALEEARAAYGLRDDNSGILVVWPAGLLRRAMLVAGERLAERGQISTPSLSIEAPPGDIAAALEGTKPVDGEQLHERAAFRQLITSRDAPRTFGPSEPPAPVNIPGALGLLIRAFMLVAPGSDGEGEHPAGEALRGLGIGTEAYEGRARLVLGAGSGFDSFEPGDVLVAPMTSPSYNVVLALAGALVTEEGDAFSHAAIMAREIGIPAVIGAPGATVRISDGDRVLVDPVAGSVRVLEPAATAAHIGGNL